jgi:hypothetical protein
VETTHTSREGWLAVTKGGLDGVALGFEPGVVLVGALPTPTTRWGDLGDPGLGQMVRGEKALVREWLTHGAIADRQLKPMDRQGPATAAEQAIVARAQHGEGCTTARPRSACEVLDSGAGLPNGQTLIARGRGVGLSATEASATVWPGQLTQGVVAVARIPPSGEAVGGQGPGRLEKPACASHALAVLVVVAGWRQEVLRRPREHV